MRSSLVVAALALVALALPATVAAKRVALEGTFSGKAEKPGPGDSDGKGTVTIQVNTKDGAICWELEGIKKIDKPLAAHIHKGKKGVAGQIVVDISKPRYTMAGCTRTTALPLARDIAANPAGYYVNIHTKAFPNGAIRAQLAAAG
jgi:CHRD domain